VSVQVLSKSLPAILSGNSASRAPGRAAPAPCAQQQLKDAER